MTDKKATTPVQQLLIDLGPLVLFFATYKLYDIYVATVVFMVAILGSMIASKILINHVSGMLKFTFVIVMVLGGLTIYFHEATFLKMKPTFVYGLFALVLAIAMARGKLILKELMSKAIDAPIDDSVWKKLTKQAIFFFIVLMVANEIIWRTQSTDTWVTTKVFGFTGVSIAFTFWIVFVLMKYMPDEDEPGQGGA